jgi:hypothetical protein
MNDNILNAVKLGDLRAILRTQNIARQNVEGADPPDVDAMATIRFCDHLIGLLLET